jgi:hypothetical protein
MSGREEGCEAALISLASLRAFRLRVASAPFAPLRSGSRVHALDFVKIYTPIIMKYLDIASPPSEGEMREAT